MANLSMADLRFADLSMANLTEANLYRAIFPKKHKKLLSEAQIKQVKEFSE